MSTTYKHEVFLNTKDLSEYLGLAEITLKKWRARNYGPPFFKQSNLVWYSKSDVDAWLETQKLPPSHKPAAKPNYEIKLVSKTDSMRNGRWVITNSNQTVFGPASYTEVMNELSRLTSSKSNSPKDYKGPPVGVQVIKLNQ